VTKKNETPDRSELKALKAKEMALESEISRLKAELKAERLKAEAYSVMIDVAEEQFGVDIRKKAGAKQ
jgi:cell division protein FtsB